MPRCTFTLPEYAAVGMSEAEAAAKNPIKVSRFPFKSLGMGQCLGELEGLVKIIAHAQTDQILGAHIIGPHAADMIHEIAVAMRGGLAQPGDYGDYPCPPDVIRGGAGGGPGPPRSSHSYAAGRRLMSLTAPEWLITKCAAPSGAEAQQW